MSKRIYFVLPAAVTGDLWHLAATLNLVKYEAKDREVSVVFAVSKDIANVTVVDEKSGLYNQRNNGAMTFNFLKNMGYNPLMAVIDSPGSMVIPVMDAVMAGEPVKKYDDLYDSHQKYLGLSVFKHPGFEQVFHEMTKPGSKPFLQRADTPDMSQLNTIKKIEDTNYRVLPYLMATTLATQLLVENKAISIKDQLVKLSGDMSRYHVAALNEIAEQRKSDQTNKVPEMFWEVQVDVKQQLEDKIKELKAFLLLDIFKDKTDIIFYNNRANTVNPQTSSKPETFEAFKKAVGLHRSKTGIVVIETGGEITEYSGWPSWDFFNKKKGGWRMPGLNPLVTCAFWEKMRIHQDSKTVDAGLKQVFGVFSGRTGSLDVAAFNGVNCFWWDEPWVEYATNVKATVDSFEPSKPGIVNFAAVQIPQCLRCIQMHLFTVVGLPANNLTFKDNWADMRDFPFLDWLRDNKSPLHGHAKLYYPAPAVYNYSSAATWRLFDATPGAVQKTMAYFRKQVERPDVGVKATALVGTGYEL